MAAVTRAGWTGLLLNEAMTATATASQGPMVGSAVPGDANLGTMVLAAYPTLRDEDGPAVVVEVSRGGEALGAEPAELLAYVDGDPLPYGWMDPSCTWGAQYAGQAAERVRLCRWGGRWSGEIFRSSDVWTAPADVVPNDACPAGDGQVLHVSVASTGVGYRIDSRWYQRDLSPTAKVIRSSQLIGLDIIYPTTFEVDRVRVAVWNGSAILVIQATDSQPRLYQWASTDLGRSWTYIGSTEDTEADEPAAIADLEQASTGIVFAYGTDADGSQPLRVGLLQSPFVPLWQQAYSSVGADMWDTDVDDIEAAVCAAETGEVYVIGLNTPTMLVPVVSGKVYGSRDATTWSLVGSIGTRSWWVADEAVTRPTATDAVWTGGGIVWSCETTTRWELRIGGWSQYAVTSPTWGGSIPLRGYTLSRTPGWDAMYLPLLGIPTAAGWGYGTNGAPTETVTGEYLRLVGSGSSALQSYEIGGSEADLTPFVLRARFRAECNVTRSTHQAPVFVELSGSNGTKALAARVAIGSTDVRVYGRTGTTSYAGLSTATDHDLSGTIEWYVWASFDFASAHGTIHVRGRAGDDPMGLDGKAWTFALDVEDVAMVDVFADAPATVLTWGSWLATDEVADWYEVWFQTQPGAAPAAPVAESAQGRPLTGPILVAPDVLVGAVEGQAYDGDTWTIANDHEHRAGHVLDQDVGLVWRSGGLTEASLTLTLDNPIAGPLAGVCLRGLVSEGVVVEAQIDGAWTEVIGDGDHVIQLAADRTGTTYRPNVEASLALRENEFAGAHLSFDDEVRAIADNRPGWWGGAGAVPTIRTVDATLITADDGPIEIYPRDVLVVVPVPVSSILTAVRVTWPNASHGWAEGATWALQRALVGPVAVLADETDWTSSVRTSVATRATTLPSGRTRARRVLPARREIEMAWTDGIDTTRAELADRSWLEVDGEPVADVGATPWTLQGVLDRVGGDAGDVVAMRVIGDQVLLNRRHQWVHGRIVGVVAVDAIQGEEHVDQVVRVGTITIREEV